jgi:hypothetical protein
MSRLQAVRAAALLAAGFGLFAPLSGLSQDRGNRPTAEDRKPFVSDRHLCTVYKPSGKENEWAFKTNGMGADGVVRMEQRNIMNLFLYVRCQHPQPGRTLTVSDDSVQRYADGILNNRNLNNQKLLRRGKTTSSTGDECWTLEFEYERAKSPDVFELRVHIFLSKVNGNAYILEVYSPKGVYDKLGPQLRSSLSRFSVRRAG